MKKSLLALLLLLVKFLQAQEVLLGFKPEGQKNFGYVVVSEGTLSQSVMGVEQSVYVRTETRYSYFIRNASKSDDVEILVFVDTIKAKISTKPSRGDTIVTVLPAVRFKQVLDKFGRRKSFEVFKGEGESFPEDLLRETINPLYLYGVIFPDKKVKVGDNWDIFLIDTVSIEGGKAVVKTQGKCVYAGVEEIGLRKCAKLNVETNFSISGRGTLQGVGYRFEGQGKNIGILFVDLKSGLPVHSDNDTEVEFTTGDIESGEAKMFTIQKIRTVAKLIN